MKTNILICTPLRFYCQNDETVYFEWISKIKSIKNVQGIGRELHLTIDTNKISNQDLLDLMGLFARYKFKK